MKMAEAEWLTCTSAAVMPDCVKGGVSDRKMRLFAVACSRQLWHSVVCRGQSALEIAELDAGGCANKQRWELWRQTHDWHTAGRAASWALSSRLRRMQSSPPPAL